MFRECLGHVTEGVRFSLQSMNWTEEMDSTDAEMAHVRYALCRGGDGGKWLLLPAMAEGRKSRGADSSRAGVLLQQNFQEL